VGAEERYGFRILIHFFSTINHLSGFVNLRCLHLAEASEPSEMTRRVF
jgi:hypothetical protein